MELNEKLMNEKLLIEWMERYSSLSKEEYEIFVNIKRLAQEDLEIFYKMNEIILIGEGEIRDNDLEIQFNCYGDEVVLYSSFGQIKLKSTLYREIITGILDIYERVYPMGTVVDLKKEYFKDKLPIEEIEHIRVVIQARFVEVGDTMYIPYIGTTYPIDNVEGIMSNIHFTPKAIKNVVFAGYSDDEEISYIFQKKKDMILEKNKHSTAFATLEELKKIAGI